MKNATNMHIALLLLLLITPALFAATDAKNTNSTWSTYGKLQVNDPKITANYHKGNGAQIAQIIILNSPFRDNGILPYTTTSAISQHQNSIKIQSTPGEYEPASFVIQAGKQKLQAVKIEASDLISEDKTSAINANNIDVRLVKTWFQSSDVMRRTDRDAPKRLVPELLLHDSGLVKVDYDKQTNSIRTQPTIHDTDSLLPFNLPASLNQQIWLTVLTPTEAKAGYYTGKITINATMENEEPFAETIDVSLRVLPFQLQETSMLMGQFYLARLVKPYKTYFSARGKNKTQMTKELNDMKQHGVNLMTLDHGYNPDADTSSNIASLKKQIKLIKESGFTTNPIVYVDWKVSEHNNIKHYQNKLNIIKNTFNSEGIDDFWIYNRDEKKLSILQSSIHTFDAAHNIGSKNIVAITKPNIAKHLRGYLDFALIQHRSQESTINKLKTAGIIPIAYGLPHAGEEKPETTRYTYGLKLVEKGFAGTLSYAYQAGECWDDWMHWQKSNYRPNVMAYPTSTKPIPTIQWEAWREGVDDLKYLETYAKLSGKAPRDILNDASSKNISSPDAIRNYLIEKILIFSE